jgi:hypothetical protein
MMLSMQQQQQQAAQSEGSGKDSTTKTPASHKML